MDNQNYVSAKHYVLRQPRADRIILIDDYDEFEKTSTLADLKYETYVDIDSSEFYRDQDEHWDWEAIRNIRLKDGNKEILVIAIEPYFEMLSNTQLKEKCIDYMWEIGMTRTQAIAYYYCHDRGKAYGTVATYMRIKPQSVNSIYKSAEEKMRSYISYLSGGAF